MEVLLASLERSHQMAEKKVPPFEKALKQLEAIVEELESPDLALDKAVKAYQKGQGLIETCQQQLSAAEKELKVLEE